MAQDYVKSTYVEFHTRKYFGDVSDKQFDEDKFEEDYKKNPNRLTPMQIQACGYDALHSRLWDKFIDDKYDALRQALLCESLSVVYQIQSVIEDKFPDIKIEVYEGEIRKYVEPKLRTPYIDVCGNDNEYIRITPTLDDKDEDYFSIYYSTSYLNKTIYCDDVNVIAQVGKFREYTKTGVAPSTFVNKMHHKYENQYSLQYGKHTIELYDAEMMQLYHTLAKEMNKVFGTNFPYSQTMIDRLWKYKVSGNIKYVGAFSLHDTWGDRKNLMSTYFYDDDRPKKVAGLQCYANYGDFGKEELIELLETLQPYATSNYFAIHSKEFLDAKYDSYDKIGILYDKRPNYFADLEYVC